MVATFADNFSKMVVTSNADWDEEHPAGTLLDDILWAEFWSYADYIRSGYETGGGNNVQMLVEDLKADDMQMINFLIESEIPFVIIFTKADKLSKRQREERMAGFAQEIPYFSDIEHVEFSAENGEGADKIRNIICELAESGNDDIG